MGKNGENEKENGWIPDRILGYHFSVGNSRFPPLSSRMENTK